MPASQPPNRYNATNPSARDVSNSNSTLNQFLGGTRRSWMDSTSSVLPSPRPTKTSDEQDKHKRTEQHKQQQKQQRIQQQIGGAERAIHAPRDFLPSRRGVDEAQTVGRPDGILPFPSSSHGPSPAVSTLTGSSAVRPAFLTQALPDSSEGVLSGLQLPVTEARFVVEAPTEVSDDGQTTGPPEVNRTADLMGNPAPVARPGSFQVHGSERLSALSPSDVQDTPRRLSANEQLPQPDVTLPSMLLKASVPGQFRVSDTAPQAKRRRTSAELAPLPEHVKVIKAYVSRQGGMDAFTRSVEQPRIRLLEIACQHGDYFFVALHQLSCLWSIENAKVCKILRGTKTDFESGFSHVEALLKQNKPIHPDFLSWLACFPENLEAILQGADTWKENAVYSGALGEVAGFLKRMGNTYEPLQQRMTMRRYPFLVDELIGLIQCTSQTLQTVFFTAARRKLGVREGPLSQAMDQAFHQDQNNHKDQAGTFVPLDWRSIGNDVEKRNGQLIEHYKSIVQQDSSHRVSRQQSGSISQLYVSSPTSPPISQQQGAPPLLPNSGQASAMGPRSPYSPVTSTLPSSHQVHAGAAAAFWSDPTSTSPLPHVGPIPSSATSFAGSSQARQYQMLQSDLPLSQRPGISSAIPPQFQSASVPQGGMLSWNSALQMAQVQTSSPSGTIVQGQQHRAVDTHLERLQQQHLRFLQQQQQLQQHNLSRGAHHQRSFYLPQQAPLGQQSPTDNTSLPERRQHMLQPQEQQEYQHQPAQVASQPITQEFRVSNPPSVSIHGQQYAFLGARPQASNSGRGQAPSANPLQSVSPVTLRFPGDAQERRPQRYSAQQHAPAFFPAHAGPEPPLPQFSTAGIILPQRPPQEQPKLRPAQPQLELFASCERLIPRPGSVITLSEYPHGPTDDSAIRMSLHQANVRSPRRRGALSTEGVPEEQSYYQAVRSLVVPPARIVPARTVNKYQFHVTEEQMALRPKRVLVKSGEFEAEHADGSLRWRVRTCKASIQKSSTLHEWAVTDTSWPSQITMALNGEFVAVRRKAQHGKDHPSDLTYMVCPGTNELAVTIPEPPFRKKDSTDFVIAVELVEIRSHSSIISSVWNQGLIPAGEMLETVKSRLSAGQQEDDDSVVVAAQDLSIDVCDPFTRCIWDTPVRGIHCTHLECMDLEVWLQTRPRKPLKCPHSSFMHCNCAKNGEPSLVDRWKCPICDKDARPYSLRVVAFLLDVRKQLETKLGSLEMVKQTKSILVGADGSWREVMKEASPDDDEDVKPMTDKTQAGAGTGAQAGLVQPVGSRSASGTSAAPSVTQRPIEVIVLDDD